MAGQDPAATREWRFATYNTLNLFQKLRGPELDRYEQVAEVIRGLDADVVAVQEIIAEHPPMAGALLGQLAKMTGMTAAVTPAWANEDGGEPPQWAVGVGGHTFHTGLLWRSEDPEIVPEPESLESRGAPDIFHSLVTLNLQLNGTPVTFASYHALPFGRQTRADQAERVLGALTRPRRPVLMGGDLNAIGATRIETDHSRQFYDPDPYSDTHWFDDLVFQCDWRWEPEGRRVHWADRRPTDVFVSGGLIDAAPAVGAPWHPTTGHYHHDEYGQRGISRRIDAIYTAADLRPRLRGYEVIDTALTREASDFPEQEAVLTLALGAAA